MVWHFLEMYYHIFRHYSPHELFDIGKHSSLKDFMKKEEKEKQERMKRMSTRHSRFGTAIVKKDKFGDGQRIFSTVGDAVNERGNVSGIQQQRAPVRTKGRIGKDLKMKISGVGPTAGVGASGKMPDSKTQIDVKNDLKAFSEDILENTFA